MEEAAALRAAVSRMVELKQLGADAADIDGACHAAAAALLRLRAAHNAAALAAGSSEAAAAVSRDALDHGVRQLQGLVYERTFYEREIAGCSAPRRRGAAADDADTAAALPPPTAEAARDPAAHQRRLQQLTQELEARKALVAALGALQSERQSEAAAAAALSAKLASLRDPVRGITRAGAPLAAVLGPRPPGGRLPAAPRGAALLPAPLWTLHALFSSAKAALGLPLDVRLGGSEAAAEEEAARRAAADAAAAAAAAAAAPASSGAHSGEGAAAEAGAFGQRRRVGTRDPEEVYKLHPLSVVVTLLRGSGGSGGSDPPLAEVAFSFYTAPGLVGASWRTAGGGGGSAGADPLAALFPGDTGDGEGYEVLAQLAGPGPYPFGTPAAAPRPYRWAQELSGSDPLPPLPPPAAAAGGTAGGAADAKAEGLDAVATQRRQQRVQVVVERLQQACGLVAG